jgi:hypothetical protein
MCSNTTNNNYPVSSNAPSQDTTTLLEENYGRVSEELKDVADGPYSTKHSIPG